MNANPNPSEMGVLSETGDLLRHKSAQDPKEESNLQATLSHLDERINLLKEAVHFLGSKLSPVLKPVPECDGRMVEFDLSGDREKGILCKENALTVNVWVNDSIIKRHKRKHNVTGLENQ